jgi:hypothetical protein
MSSMIDLCEVSLYPNKEVLNLIKETEMIKKKNREVIIMMIAITFVVTAFSTYSLYKNKQLTQKLKLKNGN